MDERADNFDDSTSCPKKQRTCSESSTDESLDLISELPGFVLLHILSFLPMKDVVKTGVLSKRWEYHWISVQNLDFHDPNSRSEYVDDFVKFVDRTLVLYEGSKIRRFHVDFKYSHLFASHVDSWIRFAVRRKVEELNIELSKPLVGDLYELPRHLYNNGYLTKLRLSFFHLRPRGLFSWRLLNSLSLAYIRLSDILIQDILSGCPSLEDLVLQECSGLEHLNITSPSLKKFMVHDCYDSTNSNSVLEISAPNLQSLGILGPLYRKCRLMNLLCLVHATLKFEVITDHGDRDNDYERYHNILSGLLENLNHVEDLTIGTWCIEVLSTWELKILPSPSSKRKCLILDTCLGKWDLPGIASLLRNSPDLETLVVNITFPSRTQFWFDSEFLELYDFDGENYWKSSKPLFKCLLQNLKTVKIIGFIAGHREMDLVQFLLKHAMVLEKMVIYSQRFAHLEWRKRFMPEELLEFTQKMLSFPRASPRAVILFS